MIRQDITTELRESAGEDPDLRVAVETDPIGFLANLPEGSVLDEIQRVPQLFSYIQGIVDRAIKGVCLF